MIITIEGSRGEGKTELSKFLAMNFGYALEINEYNLRHKGTIWISSEKHTDYLRANVIIIDDVRNYSKMIEFFSKPEIHIDVACGGKFKIKTPHIILIKQSK